MLLSDALGASSLTRTEAVGVLGQLIPHWGGARLYVSHYSAQRDRRHRGAMAHGATERLLRDLRRAIREASKDGAAEAEADAIHDSVVLYMRGLRIDVDSDFSWAAWIKAWAKDGIGRGVGFPHGKP